MDCIADHRTDGRAVKADDGFVTSKNGRRTRRFTTKGWFLQVMWKDGTENWLPLKELKESHPVEVAEYAEANKLLSEPAFAWWAPFTLKKRNKIIAAIKTRSKKKTHKYGVQVPKTVREAYELDKINGNTLWRDAIAKEMKNVMVAFDILEPGRNIEPGRKHLACFMVFDVKMDMTRKARFCANGARSPELEQSVYSGVVSRKSARIAFTYAALNGLKVMAADIQNAYLQAPISEKYWTTCGPEFGETGVLICCPDLMMLKCMFV
jgi:hypothetical protein